MYLLDNMESSIELPRQLRLKYILGVGKANPQQFSLLSPYLNPHGGMGL